MDALISDYYKSLNAGAFNSCIDKTPGSTSCLRCFHDQFFNGNEIAYDCDEKRKLYLLRFFIVHTMENYHGTTTIPCDVINKWFASGHVNILSVGGGPGSDICGVLEYLEVEGKRRQVDLSVDVVRLDIEDQWDGIFNDVMKRFFPKTSCQTVHLDVNDGFDLISNKSFDVVTVSYLTSELSTEACLNLADEVSSVLVDGGVLMINDRPEAAVEQDIRSMFSRIGLCHAEHSLKNWAGYHYPDAIATAVGPKFSMNSSMFVGVK